MPHDNSFNFFRSTIPHGTGLEVIEELKKDVSYSNRSRTWLILIAAFTIGSLFLILRLTIFEAISSDFTNKIYIFINSSLIITSLIFMAIFKKINVTSPSEIKRHHTYTTHSAVFLILIILFISSGVELSLYGTFSKGVAALQQRILQVRRQFVVDERGGDRSTLDGTAD